MCPRRDISEGIGLSQRALSLARDWQLALFAPLFGWGLGYGYTVAGRIREGRELLEASVTDLVAMPFHSYHALTKVHLGRVETVYW
jgi:hypothetical protein